MRDTLVRFPWLVWEDAGEIKGYAYASEHRTRKAYQWSVEVSVYVREDARRLGVARALYGRLFEVLKRQGFYNAYAGIALPNDASVALHESLGFQKIGVYKAVGHKFGAWRDVGWWSLTLQEYNDSPKPPVNFEDLP
jgi:phosphinothricin acetyltransferase